MIGNLDTGSFQYPFVNKPESTVVTLKEVSMIANRSGSNSYDPPPGPPAQGGGGSMAWVDAIFVSPFRKLLLGAQPDSKLRQDASEIPDVRPIPFDPSLSGPPVNDPSNDKLGPTASDASGVMAKTVRYRYQWNQTEADIRKSFPEYSFYRESPQDDGTLIPNRAVTELNFIRTAVSMLVVKLTDNLAPANSTDSLTDSLKTFEDAVLRLGLGTSGAKSAAGPEITPEQILVAIRNWLDQRCTFLLSYNGAENKVKLEPESIDHEVIPGLMAKYPELSRPLECEKGRRWALELVRWDSVLLLSCALRLGHDYPQMIDEVVDSLERVKFELNRKSPGLKVGAAVNNIFLIDLMSLIANPAVKEEDLHRFVRVLGLDEKFATEILREMKETVTRG